MAPVAGWGKAETYESRPPRPGYPVGLITPRSVVQINSGDPPVGKLDPPLPLLPFESRHLLLTILGFSHLYIQHRRAMLVDIYPDTGGGDSGLDWNPRQRFALSARLEDFGILSSCSQRLFAPQFLAFCSILKVPSMNSTGGRVFVWSRASPESVPG